MRALVAGTSRTFWEGFAPAALADQPDGRQLQTVFLSERDWSPTETTVTLHGVTTRTRVAGDGDLDVAAAQVCRFLALKVGARTWPDIGRNDWVIAEARRQLPALRPSGFHSPYEAAAWAVLS